MKTITQEEVNEIVSKVDTLLLHLRYYTIMMPDEEAEQAIEATEKWKEEFANK